MASSPSGNDNVDMPVEKRPRVYTMACRFCKQQVPAKGFAEHERGCLTCVVIPLLDAREKGQQTLGMSPITNEFGLTTEAAIAVVGGSPLGMEKWLTDMVETGRFFGWKNSNSARKAHQGLQFGCGFSRRTQAPYRGTHEALAEGFFYFYSDLIRFHREQLEDIFSEEVRKEVRELLVSCHDRCGQAGEANIYVGISYIPRSLSTADQHAPPPAVAKILGVDSCEQSCDLCKRGDHHSCKACPLHYDEGDAGVTCLYLWQASKIQKCDRAYFCLGDSCFAMRSGFFTVFNGASVLHGTWQAPGSKHTNFIGAAMVRKVSKAGSC